MRAPLADFELYPDVDAAIAALQTWDLPPPPGPPLPSGVEMIGCVTVIRPDNTAIRIDDFDTRPGLRYRDLVLHHRHRRLVIDLGGLQPFGHPFHDDLICIGGALGSVGGRFAICGAEEWYTWRFEMYSNHIRVVDRR